MVLKTMIAGEAITKFVVIVKAQIFEDGVSHVFVHLTYWLFAEQAFTLVNGLSICGSGTNSAQAHKLAGIDW